MIAPAVTSAVSESLEANVSATLIIAEPAKSATSKLVIELPVPLASIVLFVNVFVEEAVATVLSIANVTISPEIVEVIPVPPAIVNVSVPKLIVVVVDVSSAIVKLPLIAENDSTPEPFVIKASPLEPSVLGKVNVISEATLFGALSAIKLVPLLVPSLNLIVPPVDTLLPINNSSIALFASTSIADEAVNVPIA